MNTEAIREKFTMWRDSDFKERFNKLSFVGFAPSIAQASNFAWMGYQQAVKDMDINIQPIITAINMLERDGTTVRDEISDELRELVDKIKEFQS